MMNFGCREKEKEKRQGRDASARDSVSITLFFLLPSFPFFSLGVRPKLRSLFPFDRTKHRVRTWVVTPQRKTLRARRTKFLCPLNGNAVSTGISSNKRQADVVIVAIVAQLRARLCARGGARSRARDRHLAPGRCRAAHRGRGRGGDLPRGPQALARGCCPACNPRRRRFGGSGRRQRGAKFGGALHSSSSIRGRQSRVHAAASAHPLSAARRVRRQVRCGRSESARFGETSGGMGPRAERRAVSKKAKREERGKKAIPDLSSSTLREKDLKRERERRTVPPRPQKISCLAAAGCWTSRPPPPSDSDFPFFFQPEPQLTPFPPLTLTSARPHPHPTTTGSRASSRSSRSSPSASSPLPRQCCCSRGRRRRSGASAKTAQGTETKPHPLLCPPWSASSASESSRRRMCTPPSSPRSAGTC